MKKIICALFTFNISQFLFGQTATLPPPPIEYTRFIKKADSLYNIKDYKNAALTYSSAFKIFGGKGYLMDRYNAACSWALANNPDSAFFNLQRIANMLGFADHEKTIKEVAFNSLHNDIRWQPLLDRIKQNHDIIKQNTKLGIPAGSGWFRAGSEPYSYYMGNDTSIHGLQALTIKSIDTNITGFGTLMMQSKPDKYVNKRIRMAGEMKSKDVVNWSGLWLRVDGTDFKQSLSFDNMYDRPIKGATDWKKYEIVLDVPSTATNIAFGALLNGTGQIWFNNIKIEIVDDSVPTTGRK